MGIWPLEGWGWSRARAVPTALRVAQQETRSVAIGLGVHGNGEVPARFAGFRPAAIGRQGDKGAARRKDLYIVASGRAVVGAALPFAVGNAARAVRGQVPTPGCLPTPSGTYLPRYPAPSVPWEVGTYPMGLGT